MLLCVLVASGCYTPTFDEPTCGPNGECPGRWTCRDGSCVSGTPDDAVASDTTDAPAIDAALVDAAVIDAAMIDAEMPDPTQPDARRADARPPDASYPDAGPCPASYRTIVNVGTNSRYRVVARATSWLDAEESCERDGHHLVVLDHSIEFNAIARANTGGSWIGLTDRVMPDDEFLVVNGDRVHVANWRPGQPHVEGPGCALARTEGLEDAECGELLPYVCECDGRPAWPGTY